VRSEESRQVACSSTVIRWTEGIQSCSDRKSRTLLCLTQGSAYVIDLCIDRNSRSKLHVCVTSVIVRGP